MGMMMMMRMRMRADLGRPALRSPDHNFVLRVNPLQLSSCCTKNVVSLGFHKNRKKKRKSQKKRKTHTKRTPMLPRGIPRCAWPPWGLRGGLPGGPRRSPEVPRRSPEVPGGSPEVPRATPEVPDLPEDEHGEHFQKQKKKAEKVQKL